MNEFKPALGSSQTRREELCYINLILVKANLNQDKELENGMYNRTSESNHVRE